MPELKINVTPNGIIISIYSWLILLYDAINTVLVRFLTYVLVLF